METAFGVSIFVCSSQAMTLSKWDELEGNKTAEEGSASDTTPVYDHPTSPKQDLSTKKYEGAFGFPFLSLPPVIVTYWVESL